MAYPKATLRRCGVKMMTTTVKLNIGVQELEAAVVDTLTLSSDERIAEYLRDCTKAEVWKCAVSLYERRGTDWFPEGRDVDDIREKYGAAIAAKIAELFPELRSK